MSAQERGKVPVTLMFTDIEGSTVLLERMRERYALVLEQQRDILRAAFERHSGHEVDTQGDSFFVVFASAAEAVTCAVEIQRDLAAHEWPDGVQLRVRVGVHTGHPAVTPTGYVGIDVHRGARIGAAAHGGQVLTSEATREAAKPELPSDVELEGLGSFRFKGLTDPVAVFQVHASGLPTDFPSIRVSQPEDEPPSPGDAPYKGLLRFEEEDAERFFGREELVARIVAELLSTPFLAVVGASGSGKSSVVRAGVVPALRRAGERVLVMTPTADARAELEAALATKPSVLVVDQFEELFTLCRDAEVRGDFVDRLMTAIRNETRVLFTLRADFYENVAGFPDLRSAVAEHQLYIGPMESRDLRRAIEEPARRGGWEIAPGLVDLLLRDVGTEPGALPLLSHALLETWQRRRGSLMTLKGYFESGEVRGAIARTADRLYGELSGSEQQQAREILLRLTELGEGTQDTRRQATLDELLPEGAERGETEDVLRRLVDARLVTVDDGSAEVAHEALIREWPLLGQWLHDDREGIRTQRQITLSTTEWTALNHEPSLLYRGARLATAREWADAHPRALNAQERAFIDASIEAEEVDARERAAQQQRALDAEHRRAEEQVVANRRLRRRAAFLTMAVLVAAGLGLVALLSAGQASDQASRANQEANRANAQATLANDQANRADQEASLANAQATLANNQADRANQEANRANAQATLANDEAVTADQQSKIALSRQLAAQAADARDTNLDLSLLLDVEGLRTADTADARSSLLGDLLSQPQLETVLAQTGHLAAAALAPDDSSIATIDNTGSVSDWDLVNQRQLANFTAGSGDIGALALSADGKTLAGLAGPLDGPGRIDVYGLATGSLRSSFVACPVADLHLNPDGTLVAESCDTPGGGYRIYDAATGNAVATLCVGGFGEFSPTGDRLAVACDDNTVKIYDSHSGMLLQSLDGGLSPTNFGNDDDLTFADDGQAIEASYGGPNSSVTVVWDLAGSQARQHVPAQFARFLPGGHAGVVAVTDTDVELWDLNAKRPSATFECGRPLGEPVLAQDTGELAYEPGGSRLAVACGSGVQILSLPDLASIETLRPPGFDFAQETEATESIAFLPGGGLATLAYNDSAIAGSLTLWNVDRTDRLGHELTHFSAPDMSAIAVSPDLSVAAVLSQGGASISLWDIGSQQVVGTPLQVTVNPDGGPDVAFSGDGRLLAEGEWGDPDIAILDVASREVIARIPQAGGVRNVVFSHDGTFIAVGGSDTITIWNTADQTILRTIDRDGQVSFAFSPDNSTLAIANGPKAELWDVASGQEIGPLNGQFERAVWNLAFSPDGTKLVTTSFDQTAVIWDAHTRQPIGTALPHDASVLFSAFSPDSSILATFAPPDTYLWDVALGQLMGKLPGVAFFGFSGDGLSLIGGAVGNSNLVEYDLDPQSWTAEACAVAGRNLTQAEWSHYLGDQPYHETCPDAPTPTP